MLSTDLFQNLSQWELLNGEHLGKSVFTATILAKFCTWYLAPVWA